MNRYDAIVVGGGIVGAFCARELISRRMSVAVIEPGIIGGGATAEGMGHLVIMDDNPDLLLLTKWSRELWDDLASSMPNSAEYRKTGTLWLAANSAEMIEAESKRSRLSGVSVESSLVSSTEMLRIEPNISTELAGGLLVPDDVVIYPPAVAKWLLEGTPIIKDKAVSISDREVALASGQTLVAEHIVVTCGHQSPQLEPSLKVEPRKGILLITDRYPGLINHQLVELGYAKNAAGNDPNSVAFNAQPRVTGQILLGSTRQFEETGREIDWTITESLVRRSSKFLPQTTNLKIIRTWSGFRASTPDKLPIVDCVNGVWHNTGHEGLGITLAPSTARLTAQMISGESPALDANRYRADRFEEVAHA